MRKPLEHIFPDPPLGLDPAQLDQSRIPRHIAVIMDGNGRWAKKRALNRLKGHKAGIEAVRETIRCANDLGVDYLTIYSFSTENWKRPEEEVNGLMELFAKTMLAEVDELHEEHVRVRTIGDLSALPQKTRDAFDEAWEKTKNNSGMTLVVAVNYGSRQEILHATQKLMQDAADSARSQMADAYTERARAILGVLEQAAAEQKLDEALLDTIRGQLCDTPLCDSEYAANAPESGADHVSATPVRSGVRSSRLEVARPTEERFEQGLYTVGIPDPELLIRTSGEMRVSNFLLWQIAYTEFYCSDVLWPDFCRYDLLRALLDYQQRDRRFGAV